MYEMVTLKCKVANYAVQTFKVNVNVNSLDQMPVSRFNVCK
jgi:hypothetical protein